MNGLPYYKAYPRDFIEGTIGMAFEDKCAYRVILDLIYMQGGELPDDARYISGLLGCSIRKWKSIRARLIDADKIHASGAFLMNYRAVSELESLAKLQEKQRENASGYKKNSNLKKPRLRHTEPEPEPEVSSKLDTKARKRAVRLPADWILPDEWFQVALDIGLEPDVIREEADEIRDWSHSSPKGAKLDWLATWQTWCRRVKREKEDENRNNANRQSERQRRVHARRAALSKALHNARNGD